MIENNNIENLFNETFKNFEPTVDASVWNGIENSLKPVSPATTHVATQGISSVVKIISGIVAAAALTVTAIYFSSDKKEVVAKNTSEPTNQSSITPQQPKENLPVVLNPNKSKQNFIEQKISVAKKNTLNKQDSENSIADKKDISSTPEIKTESDTKAAANEKSTVASRQTPEITKQTERPIEKNPEVSTTKTSGDEPTVKENKNNFPFPVNTFAPQGNEANRKFKLETEGLNLKEIRVLIFNTDMRLVYKWNNIDGYWDGKTLKGEDAPAGTYYISIFATSFENKIYETSQKIYLIR